MRRRRRRGLDDDDDDVPTRSSGTRNTKIRRAKRRARTVDARWTSKRCEILSTNLCRRRRDSSRDDDDDDDARLPANHHSVEFVFASLFDGHGSKECAQFCAEETLVYSEALDSLEAELNDEEKREWWKPTGYDAATTNILSKISRISRTRLSFFLSFSHSFTLSHTHSHTHSLSRAQNPEDVFEYLLPSALKLAFEAWTKSF